MSDDRAETTTQCENTELVAAITAIVRDADQAFQRTGGSSRHWVRDCFLPMLNAGGLCVRHIEAEPFRTDGEIDAAFPPPPIGDIWKTSDGRQLRVVGHGRNGRIACRNAETNRLSYVQRRYFHGATDGNWSLERALAHPVVSPRTET